MLERSVYLKSKSMGGYVYSFFHNQLLEIKQNQNVSKYVKIFSSFACVLGHSSDPIIYRSVGSQAIKICDPTTDGPQISV